MQQLKEKDEKIFLMQYYEHRLKTFVKWPFTEGCQCTAEKMAEAGFFYTPESNNPDLVQCFFCGKELDGWDPNDDPLAEHKSHSKKCPFLKVKKPLEMTVQDSLKLFQSRHILLTNDKFDKKKTQFEDFANSARSQMHDLM